MPSLGDRKLLDIVQSFVSQSENTTDTPWGNTSQTRVPDSQQWTRETAFFNSSAIFDASGKLWNTLNTSGRVTIGTDLTDVSTTSIPSLVNNTLPEVTFLRPEVPVTDGIGAAEYVVIGAAIVVAFLAILAILLRLILPVCRAKSMKNQNLLTAPFGLGSFDSKLSGCTNLGVEISSQSSGTGSTQDWSQSTGSGPSTDWSDVSSDQTKNPSEESSDADCGERYSVTKNSPDQTHVVSGSTTSLPIFLQDEKLSSTKSSPIPKRRQNDESISVISAHSLEPLRLDRVYRSRWEDNWDPYAPLQGNSPSLEGLRSDSRLSLTSGSSHSSNTTFPIPSRDLVRTLNQDKERRYPSNVKVIPAARKEKQVRPPPTTTERSDVTE